MHPWTIREALGSLFTAVIKQPMSILVVGILPALWLALAPIVLDAFVSDDSLWRRGTFTAVLLAWVISAWASIWLAGQVSAAIDTVGRRPVRWRPFVTGLTQAPALFVTLVVPSLPGHAWDLVFALDDSPAWYAKTALTLLVVIFFHPRITLWAILIVDAQLPLWAAFRGSWTATRGHWPRIVALGFVLTFPTIPLFALESIAFPGHRQVSGGVIHVLFMLAAAQLYAFVDRPRASGGGANHAQPKTEELGSGTGWSRPVP